MYNKKNYNNNNNYYYDNDLSQYCRDLSPHYGDINLDSITGVWYGVEKIPHSKGEYKIEHTQECFYVDIKEKIVEVCIFVLCFFKLFMFAFVW